MKNFNWEEFKKGNIAVHCDTEEKAKDFLKECDKEGIRWRYNNERTITEGSNCWRVEKENTSYSCMGRFCTLEYSNYKTHRDKGLEIIKWEIEDMKELTFTEVIATIKEGQIWESDYVTIYKKNGGISISFKKGKAYSMHTFSCSTKYKLQRKEYTFQEVFKAYEEGKEIESVFNGSKYKKRDGKDGWYRDRFETWIYNNIGFVGFSLNEIRGMWYIND